LLTVKQDTVKTSNRILDFWKFWLREHHGVRRKVP